MEQSDDIVYWLALNDKRGIIPHYLLDYIIARHGSLKTFWYITKKEIMDMGFREKDADYFIDYTNSVPLGKYRNILNYVSKNKIKIIRYVDEEYPDILKISGTATHEPPILLFRKGLKIDFYKSVGIVGTRKATDFALKKTREFAQELAIQKFWIISGMANGVDTEAHYGALEIKGGRTIAVLPWMDPITPLSNENLSKEIMQKGCLLSEKIFHTGGSKKYPYIERNRITSGLSNFIIAVESGATGGTIRQVDHATAQSKPIYTLYHRESDSDKNIMKGFRLLVAKGAVPIINIGDIPNLDEFDSDKRTIKMRKRSDHRSYRLIFGFNERDAVKRYIVASKDPISEDALEIIKLENNNDSEENKTLKYYLLHSPEWKKDRPLCQRCGSEYVESRGRTWHCLTCNKYFTKHRKGDYDSSVK